MKLSEKLAEKFASNKKQRGRKTTITVKQSMLKTDDIEILLNSGTARASSVMCIDHSDKKMLQTTNISRKPTQ